jgi:hypothetical protein
MQKLSWKEKYAGILVLVIAIIYLLMQVSSIATDKSDTIMKETLYTGLKTWLVTIMGLVAGPLLLMNKTTGWVLGLPVLLFFATLFLGLAAEGIIKNGQVNASVVIPGVMLILLAAAILFLLSGQAKRNYRVSKYTVLLTLFLFIAIGGLFYFL